MHNTNFYVKLTLNQISTAPYGHNLRGNWAQRYSLVIKGKCQLCLFDLMAAFDTTDQGPYKTYNRTTAP